MATRILDVRGLKSPQPTLKMTVEVRSTLKSGDILEVIADCPTFENDLKGWCDRMGRTLLWLKDEENGEKRCRIEI